MKVGDLVELNDELEGEDWGMGVIVESYQDYTIRAKGYDAWSSDARVPRLAGMWCVLFSKVGDGSTLIVSRTSLKLIAERV